VKRGDLIKPLVTTSGALLYSDRGTKFLLTGQTVASFEPEFRKPEFRDIGVVIDTYNVDDVGDYDKILVLYKNRVGWSWTDWWCDNEAR
jgi:hypothetical protein